MSQPAYYGSPLPGLGLAACAFLGLAALCLLAKGRELGGPRFSELLAGFFCYMLVGHEIIFGPSLYGLCGRFWLPLLAPLGGAGAAGGALSWHAVFKLFEGLLAVFSLGLVMAAAGADNRPRLIAACVYCGLAYPLYGHFVWGHGGWLARLGFIDFAGSGLVFASAGAFGLGAFGSQAKISANYLAARTRLAVFYACLAFFYAMSLSLAAASQSGPGFGVFLNFGLGLAASWLGCGLADLGHGRGEPRIAAVYGLPGGLAGLSAGVLTFGPFSAIFVGLLCGAASYFIRRYARRLLDMAEPGCTSLALAGCGSLGLMAAGLFGAYPSGAGAGVWTVQALGAALCFAWFYGLGLGSARLASLEIR